MSAERRRDRAPITWSKRDGKAVVHGKIRSYSVDGCGCDACYTAWFESPGRLRALDLQRRSTNKHAATAHP